MSVSQCTRPPDLQAIPELRRRREQRIDAAKKELEAALHSPEWDVRPCCECSEEYVCDLQDKADDPVHCPKCRMMTTVASIPQQEKFRDELDSISGEGALGRKCPKCGGAMAHYRLKGYQCLRGCQ